MSLRVSCWKYRGPWKRINNEVMGLSMTLPYPFHSVVQFAGSEDASLEIPLDTIAEVLVFLKDRFHKIVDAMELLVTGVLMAVHLVFYLHLMS